MSVTADELRADLEKYLKLAENEDVEITNEGKVIAWRVLFRLVRIALLWQSLSLA